VVLSPSFDLPEECHLWDINVANTVVFTQENKRQELQQKLRDRGVEIVILENLSPRLAIQNLGDRGFNSVLWECGGVLSAKAIVEGTVQKIMAFIAPKIIGGGNSFSPVGNLGLLKMTDAFTVKQTSIRQIEKDFLIEGYLSRTC
jgi:diaminohydroxyphosphoribosylaminopyrimidine deaminase/5-amino-6-(5-phosphoribosylamino)uracil reductase